MDPTMGETQAYTGQPGPSAPLTIADIQADQRPPIEQAVADTLPVEPESPKSPIGRIDYNKPFEVVDRFNEDVVHADARVVAVLSGNAGREDIAHLADYTIDSVADLPALLRSL